jgi:hypothetical protein
VDVLTSNAKYDFEKSLQQVKDSYESLRVLVENASHAMQKDMFRLLTYQAPMIDCIAEQTLTMTSAIANLNLKLDIVQHSQESKLALISNTSLSNKIYYRNAFIPNQTWK